MSKINRPPRWSNLIIFVVVLGLWMLQTKTIHNSWNESSRLASIQALVEHGTWRIDASPYGHETGDKMLLNGHYYSEKPPLFAAVGAFFYGLLHYGGGLTLDIDGCEAGSVCVYYWLSVLVVGIPSALMAVLLYRLAFWRVKSLVWAVILTALFCLGTLIWPYSLVFNHHLPAAVALFISFYLLFDDDRYPRAWYRRVAAGLLTGAAVMFDLTSVFVALALFFIVLIYYRREVLFFTGAAIVPGLITVMFNYQIAGSFLFAYFSPEGYNFPGSPWDSTVGGQHPPDNVLLYTFRSLVGDRGMFGYAPLLMFSTVGLVRVAVGWTSNVATSIRMKSCLILLGIAGHLFFVLTRTNHFGGDAYGWRFLIPFIPILYSFIIFMVPEQFYQTGGKWIAALWGVAAMLSVFSAYQGVRATWHQVSPPVYLTLHNQIPFLGVETNLKILKDSKIDNSAGERRVRNFDVPEISNQLDVILDQNLILLGYNLSSRHVEPGQNLELTLYWQALKVIPKDYFIFTHLLNTNQTRLAGLDRRLQEGYPVAFWYPGEVVADHREIPIGDDAPDGLTWVRIGGYDLADSGQISPLTVAGTSQETSIVLSPVFIGVPPINRISEIQPQVSLDIKLGDPSVIALRGYNKETGDDTLTLTLYWESLAPTSVDWVQFIHLRNKSGAVIAQQDNLAGGGIYHASLWRPQEVIEDKVQISLAELPETDYDIVLGLYNATNGERLVVHSGTADEILLD